VSGPAPRGGTRPGVVFAVAAALVLGLFLVLALIGGGGGDQPLDPRSHERLGTSAMVALTREMGAEVAIADRLPDLADAGTWPDVMVLLTDLLSDDQRTVVEDWVDEGGRLVVTDPASPLVPEWGDGFDTVDDLGPRRTIEGRCEIDVLDGIDVSGIEPRNGGVLYQPGGPADTCVDGAFGAYIVATDRGDGTIVALGGSGLVVNAAIAEGENASVVTALVAPERGTEVLVLEPGPVAGGGGQRSLADLIPPGVARALLQLVIAFVIYALWRARRLGRPVAEPQPVAVAGSELVAATGNLLDRTESTAYAGELLRADLRRFLADHLGMPADSAPHVLAAVAAERTGADPAALHRALGPEPVTDDAELVTLAHTIDRIREEVLAHV
jgi:hypothetical protein